MGSFVIKSENCLWKCILLTNKLLYKCTKRGTMASIIFFSLDQPQVLAAKFLYLMCYKWTRVFKMYCRNFFSNMLLPLQQVPFCRDSLPSPWGDPQGAYSSSSCGDSGFIFPGCLALPSHPLRVGNPLPRIQAAAGREASGWTQEGWWRTGTER